MHLHIYMRIWVAGPSMTARTSAAIDPNGLATAEKSVDPCICRHIYTYTKLCINTYIEIVYICFSVFLSLSHSLALSLSRSVSLAIHIYLSIYIYIYRHIHRKTIYI